MHVVADRPVAYDDDGIDQILVRPAGVEEGLQARGVCVATLTGDAADQLRERVELRIEAPSVLGLMYQWFASGLAAHVVLRNCRAFSSHRCSPIAAAIVTHIVAKPSQA